jgi:hypothetical protein
MKVFWCVQAVIDAFVSDRRDFAHHPTPPSRPAAELALTSLSEFFEKGFFWPSYRVAGAS